MGLIALVFGVSTGQSRGLTSPQALVPTVGGIVLLAGFALHEHRTRQTPVTSRPAPRPPG